MTGAADPTDGERLPGLDRDPPEVERPEPLDHGADEIVTANAHATGQ